MRREIKICLFLFLTVFLLPGLAFSGSATLHWHANSESDLAEYRIYYGTASRSYGPYISVGKSRTSYTVNYLSSGKTYYFALTAVDTSGNESGYSQEVSKNIPASEGPSSHHSSPPSNGGGHQKKGPITIKIVSPKIDKRYVTTARSISLSGTADGPRAITKVVWSGPNQTGGTAEGRSEWTISSIPLNLGWNTIAIKAVDSEGDEALKVVRIERKPRGAQEDEAPTLSITKPKTQNGSYTTHERLCRIEGTASDDTGIAKVTWFNRSTERAGVAEGTESWTVANLFLKGGINVIEITAWDVSGNKTTQMLYFTLEP